MSDPADVRRRLRAAIAGTDADREALYAQRLQGFESEATIRLAFVLYGLLQDIASDGNERLAWQLDTVQTQLVSGEQDATIADCLEFAIEHDVVLPERQLDRIDRWFLDLPYPPQSWPEVDASIAMLRARAARASGQGTAASA